MAGLLGGSRRHHNSRTTLAVRAMGHVNDGGQAVIGNVKKVGRRGLRFVTLTNATYSSCNRHEGPQ